VVEGSGRAGGRSVGRGRWRGGKLNRMGLRCVWNVGRDNESVVVVWYKYI
jgi:hypothetical protein